MSKRDNHLSEWSNLIQNSKTKVERIFHKDDEQRERPFLFDGWKRDYKSGEKLITFHTKKEWDNELDSYLSYVMSEKEFKENFNVIMIEY